MKVLKQGNFNIGDIVTLKTDKATIEKLKKDNYDDVIGSLIFEEKSVSNVDEDDTVEIDHDVYIPSYALTLVTKGKDVKSKTVEIDSKENDYTLTFRTDKQVATMGCGDEIKLKDLIELGELAKEYYKAPAPRKKVAKKTSKKK